MSKLWVSVAATLGALGVVMGAFAAHGLETRVDEKALGWVKTGAQYQMTHALALLAWAIWAEMRLRNGGSSGGSFPGWGFTVGTLVFSGTLYAMALGGPRWLGAITPIGGSLMIAAWLVFAVQAVRV